MQSSAVFHRQLRNPQKVAARSEGMHIFDTSGKRYLDAVGGAAVNIVGHAVPEITSGIEKRSKELSFTYGAVFSNIWQEQLAHLLRDMSPCKDGSVFFTSGGSEANEVAIKLARQYHLERGKPTKWKILSRWQGYHGNTISTSALSGRPSWRKGFDPYFFPTPKISAPYAYRSPEGISNEALLDHWIDEFERLVFNEGAESIAAFIAEPIIGSSLAGVVPPQGYYERLKQACERHDILFIADEVLAGYGRTGRNFSIDHWNVEPDLLTAGKGVGSGYAPIAACILSARVADTIRSGSGEHTQGYTFSGSALPCYIGVNVNQYVKEHKLIARSEQMGAYLQKGLANLKNEIEVIGDVRGKGLLAGVELVKDREKKTPFPTGLNISRQIVEACERDGLLILSGSRNSAGVSGGDLLQLTPPYIISEEQIDEALAILGSAIKSVTENIAK